jgi:hypothetical protein
MTWWVQDCSASVVLPDDALGIVAFHQECPTTPDVLGAGSRSRDKGSPRLPQAPTNSRQIQQHADDFNIRIPEQASGDSRAARLLQVIRQAGIGFQVARLWPGASKAYERQLKNSGSASRYCPICQQDRVARGELRHAPRGRGERQVGPWTRMARADQQPDHPQQRAAQTAPARGVRQQSVREFMALNPAFARPVGASLAKQWGRVRGREEIEALSPRVTGARFEENELLSQERVRTVTKRAVQARRMARQQQLAERAEQTRTQQVAARTHQRLAAERAPRRSHRRDRQQDTRGREGGHER